MACDKLVNFELAEIRHDDDVKVFGMLFGRQYSGRLCQYALKNVKHTFVAEKYYVAL